MPVMTLKSVLFPLPFGPAVLFPLFVTSQGLSEPAPIDDGCRQRFRRFFERGNVHIFIEAVKAIARGSADDRVDTSAGVVGTVSDEDDPADLGFPTESGLHKGASKPADQYWLAWSQSG